MYRCSMKTLVIPIRNTICIAFCTANNLSIYCKTRTYASRETSNYDMLVWRVVSGVCIQMFYLINVKHQVFAATSLGPCLHYVIRLSRCFCHKLYMKHGKRTQLQKCIISCTAFAFKSFLLWQTDVAMRISLANEIFQQLFVTPTPDVALTKKKTKTKTKTNKQNKNS